MFHLSKSCVVGRKLLGRLFSSTSTFFSELDDKFLLAQEKVNLSAVEPSNDLKLQLYGLYKQGNNGDCTLGEPGMLNLKKKAKWLAWNELKGKSLSQAKQEYVDLADSLIKNKVDDKIDEILIDDNWVENVRLVKMNRPAKCNALNFNMYGQIAQSIIESQNDDNIHFVAVTGAGKYFTSGNDFLHYASVPNIEELLEIGTKTLEKYINAMIECEKPLIALINGPAIGIGLTQIPLYDYAVCSSSAKFYAPFAALNLTTEGCSSFTFPKYFTHSQAAALTMFDDQLSTKQAVDLGLINRIIDDEHFSHESKLFMENLRKMDYKTLIKTKRLLRPRSMMDEMKAANKEECRVLLQHSLTNFIKKIN
ncbi:hypothetical protein SNEBB_009985 [Seison nebaliae]|nr:hypothetical protein SNEBB_009985 [Seison nebaliae]